MNLVQLVEHYTGQEMKTRTGKEWYSACPFCKDGDDRFRVWLDNRKGPGWWCRVCGRKGEAIYLTMQMTGKSYFASIDHLQDLGYDTSALNHEVTQEEKKRKEKLPPPTMQSCCKVKLDYEDMEKYWITGKYKALAYLSQWGFTSTAINQHMFGWCEEKNALTIPHWWIENGQHIVKGLKFRHMTDNKKMRFSQIVGGDLSGFWNTKWISNPDGSRIGPELDYLLIVEAEKDAALLEDMGYPAVSYLRENSWNDHINTVLQNILVPIIINDVDEKDQGMFHALQIQSFINRNVPIINTSKYNVKSPSDFAKRDGVGAVHEWLQSYKLGVELCTFTSLDH